MLCDPDRRRRQAARAAGREGLGPRSDKGAQELQENTGESGRLGERRVQMAATEGRVSGREGGEPRSPPGETVRRARRLAPAPRPPETAQGPERQR